MISSSRDPDLARQLGDGGGAAELLGEVGGRRRDRQPQLLEPARHPDRPAAVPEVPLDLADDGRGRVRRELHAAVGVEAVDALISPIVPTWSRSSKGSPRLQEPAREVLDERQVQAHQLVAVVAALRLGGVLGAELREQLGAPLARMATRSVPPVAYPRSRLLRVGRSAGQRDREPVAVDLGGRPRW